MSALSRFLASVAHDLRDAVRHLRRAPGLVLVAVLSIGLGVGLNLALYAGVMTIFRHQPTMEAPSEVVGVEPGNSRQFSFLNLRDLRELAGFAGVAGFRMSGINRQAGSGIERVNALVVTADFFDLLGVRTYLGRTFTAGEAVPELTPRVVVVDHRFWRSRLNGRTDAVGQTLTLEGEPFTIVGVLSRTHRAVTGFVEPSLYVPVSALTLPTLDDRGSPALTALARLGPDVTHEQARSRASAVGAELERRFPEENEGLSRPAAVFPADALQFRGTPVGFRLFPTVLLLLFGLVLLIGSANVAGLLLTRAVSRQHELTVRAALGASRRRVVQALLAESFVLSAAGAVTGLGLTYALSRAGLFAGMGPVQGALAPDWRLLPPALLLLAVTTALCGVTPALRLSRLDLVPGLKGGGQGATSSTRLRGMFVTGQVALSLTLLVVSGLCLRSQLRIVEVDVGFDLGHGVVARFPNDVVRGPVAARQLFAEQVAERIARVPGIESVAIAGLVPLGGDALVASFHPAGRSDVPGTRPSALSVGPRYFATLAIPLSEGREFAASDRDGTPSVAIVNQTFARTYFEGRRALGERVALGGEADAEIIGVVADSKIDTIGEAPKSVVYYPFAQRPRRLSVIARTSGDPAPLVPVVRAAAAELDPMASIGVTTLRDAASTELTMRKVGTQLIGVIGIVGLLLTALGLYGVVSYSVASRTAELGIRSTLGASPVRLHREVLARAARVVGAGVILGGAISLLVTPALATFLAGLSPADPIAYVAAAALLLLIAFAASAVPARRAMRVDPVVALRERG